MVLLLPASPDRFAVKFTQDSGKSRPARRFVLRFVRDAAKPTKAYENKQQIHFRAVTARSLHSSICRGRRGHYRGGRLLARRESVGLARPERGHEQDRSLGIGTH